MAYDDANTRIRGTIKTLMKARQATYTDLAAALSVSTSTIKRMINQDDLGIARLEQVAEFFELDLYELVSLSRDPKIRGVELSHEQELYLVTHPSAARYYWLLLNQVAPEKIDSRLGLTVEASQGLFQALKSVGLVDHNKKGRIQLAHEWPLGFRFKGALHKRYTAAIFNGFVAHLLQKVEAIGSHESGSTPPDFTIRILQFVLTKTAYNELVADVSDLVRKYLRESRRQMALGHEDHETVSFMLGIDRSDAVFEALSAPIKLRAFVGS